MTDQARATEPSDSSAEHRGFESTEEYVDEVFDLQDTTSDEFDYTSSDARRRALAAKRPPLRVDEPEFDYLDRRHTGPITLEQLDQVVVMLVVVVVLQALALLAIGAMLYVGAS